MIPILMSRKEKKQKVQKKAKKKKRIASEDEEEEEEDDEARIKKEMAGFVVDEVDPEEEEAEDNEDDNDTDDDIELDDDDLDLLNDSNQEMQKRHTGGRAVIESDEEEDDRERIKNNLFTEGGDFDDEMEIGDSSQQRERLHDRTDESGSESGRSEDDFIVNDDAYSRHRRRHHNRLPHVSEQAIDDARDIFGVDDFNFAEFYDEDAEPGEEEDEYPEEEDRDEGEAEFSKAKKLRLKEKKATLLETIEPTELEEKMLSSKDLEIIEEDKPERFQLRRIPVTEATETEMDRESKWIYLHAFDKPSLSFQEENCLTVLLNHDLRQDERMKIINEAPRKIAKALGFIRTNSFEVPFIAFYRKEYVESCLVINDLWRVYHWDEKWCHLQIRKKRLLDLMRRMKNYLENDTEQNHMRPVAENDFAELSAVETMEALTDVSSKFQLYYGGEVQKMDDWEKLDANSKAEQENFNFRFRGATRTDRYKMCVQNGIDEMAARFGLTPLQFGENLEWKRHEIIQDDLEPSVAANEYVCHCFPTPEAVIAGAIHVVAKQLSREPKVRDLVRGRFRNRLKISAYPTTKGIEEIDENHRLYPRRYIKNKPVGALKHDEYLLYDQGKKAGLLDVKLFCDTDDEIKVKRTLLDNFLEEQPYYRDEFSTKVEAWNKIREEAVKECITSMLIPMFIQEAHTKLLEEAKDYVMKQCTQNLYERIKTAAYYVERDDEEDDESSSLRILSISYPQERNQASFCALVDQDGQVLDHLRLMHMSKNMMSKNPNEASLKRNDMETLRKFIERRRPHAIAISGENMTAYYLKKDIESLLSAINAERTYFMDVRVEIVDTEAAKVYMNSKQAQIEFPDYPSLLRQSVSLARLLIDPLIEYAHLCDTEDDILCLTYHPLQSELNKEDLLYALSLEFINRVNEVGVDVNRCIEFPHMVYMLQFVCGFGPRKASHLLQVLKPDNLLESRTKLVTSCQMGPKVFMNSSGFIKLDTVKVSEKTEAYVEILDGTRVHPETYEWARKMAIDALEIDDSTDPTSALEEILQNPDKLKDLDLDAFADELARQGFGNKSITLYDIRAELNHRYKDLRVPYEPPTAERLFTMLTKETSDSIGKLVLGRVLRIVYRKPRESEDRNRVPPIRNERTGQWKCQYCHKPDFRDTEEVWQHINFCPGQPVGIKVAFDSGITGFIPNKYLSDRPDSFVDPGDRVKLNHAIYCRILELDPEKFSATCSCRSSDLKGLQPQNSEVDLYFDREKAEQDEMKRKKLRDQRKVVNNFVKRVISHPDFHNVTYEDAIRMMQKFQQGEALIRPSPKSASYLNISWKVSEGIIQHVEVKEEGKQHNFSLGKILLIGPDEFEDLDEILTRHIQPMAALAREVLSHKYFLDGVKSEDHEKIEIYLIDEKKRAARIPYCFTPSDEFPGKFVISYLPRIKVRHEYFTATPDGFRFRQQMFSSLDLLLAWFKLHYRDPPPGVYR